VSVRPESLWAFTDFRQQEYKFGDHFARHPKTAGRTKTGGSFFRRFFRGIYRLPMVAPYSPKCLASSVNWLLLEHLFRPANLFGEGFGLALLKFSEVYQLPLDARQFGGMRTAKQAPEITQVYPSTYAMPKCRSLHKCAGHGVGNRQRDFEGWTDFFSQLGQPFVRGAGVIVNGE